MPPFFEKLLGLNLSDSKALHDDATGACTPKITRPRVRSKATECAGHPPVTAPIIEIFPVLETHEPRTGAFGVSLLVHIGLLSSLILLPLVFTSSLKVSYDVVQVAPPLEKPAALVEAVPIPVRPIEPLIKAPRPAVVTEPEPPRILKPPERRVEVPAAEPVKVEEPVAPVSVPAVTPRVAVPEPAIAPPRPAVQTGVFSNTDAATVNAPSRNVQTGAFGDPNGVPLKNSKRAANIASVGAGFAAAATAGYAGGLQGTAGRSVRQGGFEAVQEAAPHPARKLDADAGPPDKPVEILFKPRPDYTEEARKLRVEGEVLVHVLFKASGEISVIDIVRGLGHGLDETAMRAAQEIRFKPAMRQNQPVDSAATVHIIFQLAF